MQWHIGLLFPFLCFLITTDCLQEVEETQRTASPTPVQRMLMEDTIRHESAKSPLLQMTHAALVEALGAFFPRFFTAIRNCSQAISVS